MRPAESHTFSEDYEPEKPAIAPKPPVMRTSCEPVAQKLRSTQLAHTR